MARIHPHALLLSTLALLPIWAGGEGGFMAQEDKKSRKLVGKWGDFEEGDLTGDDIPRFNPDVFPFPTKAPLPDKLTKDDIEKSIDMKIPDSWKKDEDGYVAIKDPEYWEQYKVTKPPIPTIPEDKPEPPDLSKPTQGPKKEKTVKVPQFLYEMGLFTPYEELGPEDKDKIEVVPDPEIDKEELQEKFDLAKEIARAVAANARGEDAEVPEFVEDQEGPLPNTDELLDSIPTKSLTELGQEIGLPLREKYKSSKIGQTQRKIGDIVNYAEELLTYWLTPEMIDFLECDALVSSVENFLLDNISPFISIEEDDPVWQYVRGLTEAILWSKLDIIDPPESEQEKYQEYRDAYSDAIVCELINNNSPNCPVEFPPKDEDDDDDDDDEDRRRLTARAAHSCQPPGVTPKGFPECVYVSGFAASCSPHNLLGGRGCAAGRNIMAQELDGLYRYDTTDVSGWPVYSKTVHNIPGADKVFLNKPHGTSGAYAAFACLQADSEAPRRKLEKSPFAFTYQSGACSSLDPRTFPACLSSAGPWALARLGTKGCNGAVSERSSVCWFPARVKIFPCACGSFA
ncbi:unnamed protein product [Vitrella brassicaformis CCMP3155]|uniref:Uncharacterized protein n=1 Tax=Vitrella brassicaformis (strain CCMP3155) TaxID=1169540 RepID=A0A0G4EGE6_VITBC|nr:unnamed protein product [Vitrella brassicaformis CCMP3155]|eukprot:CEL94545.1 unnamed protein product [Vitrella brassicaformis CCMP3155]